MRTEMFSFHFVEAFVNENARKGRVWECIVKQFVLLLVMAEIKTSFGLGVLVTLEVSVHFKNRPVSKEVCHYCSLKLNNRERILNINASYSTLITYVMVCKDTFNKKRKQEHGDCSRAELFYSLFLDKKSWPTYPNTHAISKQHLFTSSI